MAPLGRALCAGTALAVLVWLWCQCAGDWGPVWGDRPRVTTLEQVLYREEERYGAVVAVRGERAVRAGWDSETRSMPNITTLQQLFPASFHCPFPLTLVGPAWVCGLAHLAESDRCGVSTVGPKNDPFTAHMLHAAPACRTTAYTPGPRGFGAGRVYSSASWTSRTGGHGWVGIGPRPERIRPPPVEQPTLVHQARDADPCAEARWCAKQESRYTLEQLLGRHGGARSLDVLRLDLPFREMVPALASLPMPSSDDDIDSWVLPMGQLILALRLDERADAVPDGYAGFRAWWESLERVGLRPFAMQDLGDNTVEYSFLNLRAPYLFTHSARL